MGKLVNNDCNVGIEIELEEAASLLEAKSTFWVGKRDGSLRDGGAELVLSKPLNGTKLVFALDEAFNVLIKKTMKCSPRTGIHVHLDATDMNVDQIRNNCVTYALVEEPLFKWVGDYRESNNFCLPWYEAEGDIELMCNLFAKAPRNFQYEAKKFHRYSAMNLNALHKFGSIEYRHLKTTLNKSRVLMWVNLLLCIKSYALKAANAETILATYHANGAKNFIKEVFGSLSSELDYKCISLGENIARDIVGYRYRMENPTFYAHLFTRGTFPGIAKYLKGKE